jgi:ribokinase/sulfofructose kinase
VAAFGEVGDDTHAQFLVREFQRHGVSTEHLRRRPNSGSAMTVILLSEHGERSVIYVPMPGPPAPREDLAPALASSRVVYTMPYDAQEFACLSDAARGAGTEVAIDVEREVARAPHRLEWLLQGCDIAFLNESGFVAGTGCAPDLEGLRALLDAGNAKTIVVSLGAQGAMAVSRDDSAVQRAYPAEVVDTTGAGDTFNAAFLYARTHWSGLQQCLAFACAAASRTVQVVGARSGLPTHAQVDAVMIRHDPCLHAEKS